MTPLSIAIRQGAKLLPANAVTYFTHAGDGCDPFGAAYIGDLREREHQGWWAFFHSASDASRADYLFRSLMRAFPHLGASVRTWSRLAEALERQNLLLRVRRDQTAYRAEIHISLWLAIDRLSMLGETKDDIADLLAGVGL